MQKMLLSILAILSLNFALSLPSSAYSHTVVEREIRAAARNPSVYRRYTVRRPVHHRRYYNHRTVSTRTTTTVHHH